MQAVAAAVAAFQDNGLLAEAIGDFTPREAQIQMAEQVAQTIEKRQVAVIEAATGTGKTFAYLLPALQAGKQALISTGTRALQEQLFHRDLPRIKQALGLPLRISLLKGRGNYLCLHRLDQQLKGDSNTSADHQHGSHKPQWQQLYQIQQWANQTVSGDIGELPTLADDAPIWPLVTSTADNCLGKHCPRLSECWVKHAREQAQQADVVVINHHLFFADMTLRDTGFGELLPGAEICIFDEAHQLPDIASDYFGQQLSTRQLTDIVRQVRQAYLNEQPQLRQLSRQADRLQVTIDQLALAFSVLPKQGEWHLITSACDAGLRRLYEELQLLWEICHALVGSSELIDHLAERIGDLLQRLQLFLPQNATQMPLSEYLDAQDSSQNSTQHSLWFRRANKHLWLHQSPLSVAERFADMLAQRKASWIFTSATLAMGQDFGVFERRLGLKPDCRLVLTSPFDYPNQALLYVPRYLPEPGRQGRVAQSLAAILPLIRESQGRCLLLFTSHSALQQAAPWLAERWTGGVLIQGQQSKRQLLKRFVDEPRSLLLGLASFWEGVDLPGKALCCVVIDKLPFPPPDEPLLQARMLRAQRQGIDGFNEVLLPQAVLALKQGAGRLIRRTDDQGVLVITDPRIITKAYGQAFISSLPPMRRTRNMDFTRQFLRQSVSVSVSPQINQVQ